MGKVRVEIGETRNLGNFESLKVSASVELDANDSDTTKAFSEARNKCVLELLESRLAYLAQRKREAELLRIEHADASASDASGLLTRKQEKKEAVVK